MDSTATMTVMTTSPAPVRTQNDETVERFESELYSRAMRLVRSSPDAWDLVQDTFEHALRGISRFQPGTNMRLWLMTIMNRLFIDRCRRKAREPLPTPIEEDRVAMPDAAMAPPWASITDEQLGQVLAELESPFREVYELRVLKRCSYDEIAEQLLIPRSTVGTRLMRARQKLRESLLDTIEDQMARRGVV